LSCSHPAKEGTTHGDHVFQLWKAHADIAKGGKKEVITSKIRRRIRRELSHEKPTAWVGKNGVTKQLIEEVSRQLKKRETVKIRILKNALKNKEANAVASEIAQQTGANLIDLRGHTAMLYKVEKGKVKSLYKRLHELRSQNS
jgi:RNA-binding protein